MSSDFFGSRGPQRESDPRMSDERNRDFGAAPSRGPEQGAGERRDTGPDALLELARLIGQSDPFAPEGSKPASMPAAGMPDGRLASVARVAAAQQPTAVGDPFTAPPDRSFEDREDRGRREPDFDEPRAPMPPAAPGGGDGLGFLRLPADRNDYPVVPRHATDERGYGRGRQQLAAYEQPDGHPGESEFAADEYDGMEPDDYDDDEPAPKRRRAGLVFAVLGLAVFGSAAAFGYRTIFSAEPSGPTPVIMADKSPTKMTPQQDTRQDSGRLGGEQMERRDEDPVDLSPFRTAPGSEQFPQDTAGGIPGNPNNIMPSTPGAAAPAADSKRVRTVAISADSGTSSRNQPRGGTVSQVQPAQSQAAQSQAVQSQAVQVQQPPTRQVVPPPPPPQRQAALAPAPAADTGAAAPGAESGGYVVQVSAVRSEADAQAAFRRLQDKYPMLGGRQPLIRRKDQGEKGTFYAAQVGPFGAKTEADQLCEQLKSAGGSCFVLRN